MNVVRGLKLEDIFIKHSSKYYLKKWTVHLVTVVLFTVSCSVNSHSAIKSIPAIQVSAVLGETAVIPCDISTPEPDQVTLVLFYREDLERYIYSVDARGGGFQEAERWSDEQVFGNRAFFRSKLKPAVLAIESVAKEDEALYRCRVDFKVGQTRNSRINLTVIEPPQQPVIHDASGHPRNIMIGPYDEESSLSLQCRVHGGWPKPSVHWYKNDELIDSNFYISNGVTINDLSMGRLTREDLDSELRCQASNNNISQPVSTSVHLDLNLSPLEVKILGKRDSLRAGRLYELLCQSVGARPPAHITWWINDQRIESYRETTSRDGNMTTSTLSFIPQKENFNGMLICKAQNQMLPKRSAEDHWILHINYKPEAHLQLGTSLRPEHIKEGSDVYFDCVTDANPPVTFVEWHHNEKLLRHNVTGGIIITNQSLVLQKVTRLSTGNYTCTARNNVGPGESLPFYLDVLYAPVCAESQPRVHGVAKLEHANISCFIEANPSVVDFRWSFNNSAESIDVPKSRYMTSGSHSTVRYTPMTELDYGTLLCWARNRVGEQKVPCVYHIIAAGKPDPVENCTVKNQSTDSFLVSCMEGFSGGQMQSFFMELYESNPYVLKRNETNFRPYFHVQGLESDRSFVARIYAYNQKGSSHPTIVSPYTLRLPEEMLTRELESKKKGKIAFPEILSIGIGTAIVLIMVLLIFISLAVRAHRRKRRHEEMESKSSCENEEVTNEPRRSQYMPPPCEFDCDEKNPDLIPSDSSLNRAEEDGQNISVIQEGSVTHEITRFCTLRKGGMPVRNLSNVCSSTSSAGCMSTNTGVRGPRTQASIGPQYQTTPTHGVGNEMYTGPSGVAQTCQGPAQYSCHEESVKPPVFYTMVRRTGHHNQFTHTSHNQISRDEGIMYPPMVGGSRGKPSGSSSTPSKHVTFQAAPSSSIAMSHPTSCSSCPCQANLSGVECEISCLVPNLPDPGLENQIKDAKVESTV